MAHGPLVSFKLPIKFMSLILLELDLIELEGVVDLVSHTGFYDVYMYRYIYTNSVLYRLKITRREKRSLIFHVHDSVYQEVMFTAYIKAFFGWVRVGDVN